MGRKRTLNYKSQNHRRKIARREKNIEANILINGQNTDKSPYCYKTNINSARAFERSLDSIKFNECSICNRRQLDLNVSNSICKRCEDYRLKAKFNPYTSENNMDPGPIPSELQVLTPIEEMLVARVHPVICFYRYKKQQSIYKHHVINFPQDIKAFTNELPPPLESLSEIILVSRNFVHSRSRKLEVNKLRVLRALRWLKENNKYYSDIVIKEENLRELPDSEVDLQNFLPNYSGPKNSDVDIDEGDRSLIRSNNRDIEQLEQEIPILSNII